MYLSRLILNPRSRRAQRELADPHELHRTLMRAFPDDLDMPDEERVLFRVETTPQSNIPIVLLQSFHEPDWTWCEDTDHYLLPPGRWPLRVDENPATKPFDLTLSRDQVLAFRLRANPTVKRDGKRHGLYQEEDQRDWLHRKGEHGGFKPLHVTVIREGNVTGRLQRNGNRHRLTFFAVRFDGLLKVTDPDTLWETLKTGIGPAKGFGFGLLSLAPPPLICAPFSPSPNLWRGGRGVRFDLLNNPIHRRSYARLTRTTQTLR